MTRINFNTEFDLLHNDLLSHGCTSQLDLVQKLGSVFTEIKHVIHVGVRGSLAKQTADFLSDIDMYVVTTNNGFAPLLESVSEIIKSCTNSMTEQGWIDRFVPNFGGLGFVFMIQDKKGNLIQQDLYVLPEKNAEKIIEFPEKRVLYEERELLYEMQLNLSVHEFVPVIKEYCDQNTNPEFQTIFESILCHFMLAKHLVRNEKYPNPFLVAKYTSEGQKSVLKLLRMGLDPDTVDYGECDVMRQLEGFHSDHLRNLMAMYFMSTGSTKALTSYVLMKEIIKTYFQVQNEKLELLIIKIENHLKTHLSPIVEKKY